MKVQLTILFNERYNPKSGFIFYAIKDLEKFLLEGREYNSFYMHRVSDNNPVHVAFIIKSQRIHHF